MPVVNFNGKRVSFPDDMSNEEIESILQSQLGDDAPVERPADPLAGMEYPIAPQTPLEAIGEGFANVPRSSWEVIKSLNPFEIGGTVMDLAQGGADFLGRKAAEYETGMEFDPTGEEAMLRGAPGALAGYYKSRYGGGDEILETLREDPIGALMDVSPVVATRFGRANPVRAVGDVVGDPLNRFVSEPLRRNRLISDIKPSTTAGVDNVDALIDTARKYDIDVDRKGLETLIAKTDEIDNAVTEAVSNAQGKLALSEVLEPAFEYAEKRGGSLAAGARSRDKVEKVILETLEDAERLGVEDLSALELNKMKRDFYNQINWKKLSQDNPTNRARQAIARGAKEGVEELVPEVGALNAEWGSLIGLREPLERAIRRMENRSLRPEEFAPLAIGRRGAETLGRNVNRPFSALDTPGMQRYSELGWLLEQIDEDEEPIGVLARP